MAYVRGARRSSIIKTINVQAPAVDVPEPPRTAPTAGPDKAHMDRCGTNAGHKRHKRAGEIPCEPCRVAALVYLREWRMANQPKRTERSEGVYNPAVCGTHNGYERHRRRNTNPCAPCRAGHAEYTAGRRAARRTA